MNVRIGCTQAQGRKRVDSSRGWSRALLVGVLCTGCALVGLSPVAGASRSPSSSTYKAGGIRFQAAFPSKVTTLPMTMAELKKSRSWAPGVVAGTEFLAGVTASEILSGANQVPKPNVFEVGVMTFGSTSAAKSDWQLHGFEPGVKKEIIDGKSAYSAVGNAATLNPGSPVPDKSATQGVLAILDGKSVFVIMAETKAAATTISFFNSIKFLP